MDSRLEIRRSNNEPKCASCGWWKGGSASAGHCERHNAPTLDMAVCSDWRDGDVLVEILEPEAD